MFKKTTLAAGMLMVLGSTPVLSVDLDHQSHLHNHFTLEKNAAYYKVPYSTEDLGIKIAISFHGSLMETDKAQKFHIIQLTNDEFSSLESLGISVEHAPEFTQRHKERLEQIQQALLAENTLAGIPNYSCYETVEETLDAAQSLITSNPAIAEWVDIGDSWEKAQGLGGFDLQVLKITNQNTIGSKPILFINSAIHAREYTTAPLNLSFARWLIEGYGVNADATWIVDHHEVHLLLQTNPDGRKKAETGLSWRKNTNQNFCSPTSNTRGVDLNRNFSFTWNITNGQGSSGSQCNLTYRGPSPASEPEVNAIETYLRSIFPDRRGPNNSDAAPLDTQGMHIDIHSYSELVLWPWGATNSPAPNGTQLQTLGRKFAFFNGYRPQQSIGLYPTDGTSDAISYGELGVPAYTFELGTAFFQSCSAYNNTIQPDNLNALIYAAKVVSAPYQLPSGPDATSLSLSNGASTVGVTPGTPVTLTSTVSDNRFNNSNGTEAIQTIAQSEYYVDIPPWETGSSAIVLGATDGTFNEVSEQVLGIIDTTDLSLGKHTIFVRGQDASGNWGPVSAEFLTITDEPAPEPVIYCDAASNNSNDEWISNIQVGSFVNSSGASRYTDFTDQVITLSPGNTSVTLTPSYRSTAYTEFFKIWIDLNNDGDFADANEAVFASASGSTSEQNGILTIPEGTAIQETRMRVVMRYNTAPSACGAFNYGEVEDYTVNIIEGSSEPLTFENKTPFDIPDNNAVGISSPISVTRSGFSGQLTVDVDIDHTYQGDLIVAVTSPSGTSFTLQNRTGGSADDIKKSFSIDASSEPSNGVWNLLVKDRANADVGTLNEWSITFSSQ